MAVQNKAQTAVDHEASLNDRLRYLANLPGQYYLEKWKSETGAKLSRFACRIQRISPQTMTLAAPVSGNIGDRVVAHFGEFGLLRGEITRPMGFGFVVALDMDKAERTKLASKIAWLERHRNFEVYDNRRHQRIMPRNPQSILTLIDSTTLPCFVIDMSVSGAAVSANFEPQIGTPIALGNVIGKVVRELELGFAIQFVHTLAIDQLETRLIRKDPPFAHLPAKGQP